MWDGMMTYMSGYGGGHMLFGGLMMVLFWGGLIALIIWLIRGRGRDTAADSAILQRPTALEILQQRYARGEIDQLEYEQRKRDLKQ